MSIRVIPLFTFTSTHSHVAVHDSKRALEQNAHDNPLGLIDHRGVPADFRDFEIKIVQDMPSRQMHEHAQTFFSQLDLGSRSSIKVQHQDYPHPRPISKSVLALPRNKKVDPLHHCMQKIRGECSHYFALSSSKCPHATAELAWKGHQGSLEHLVHEPHLNEQQRRRRRNAIRCRLLPPERD